MKGLYNGNCNRTACQQPGAIYFNHSTENYYCAACAAIINEGNPQFKQETGHDLCTQWRYIKAEPKDKQITGTLTMDKLDGTAHFEEVTTRDKAIKQLEAMQRAYPGHYEITGEHVLDGSVDLTFTAKDHILKSLTFKFTPHKNANVN
jgi:hypothetical protein